MMKEATKPLPNLHVSWICTGFTNFKMLNIFSSYSTQQTGIRANTQTDFSKFKGCLEDADMIILAWGTDRSAYKDEKKQNTGISKSRKIYGKSILYF